MLTHKQHIERDKGRYEGATRQMDTHILTGGKKRGRPSTTPISGEPSPRAGSGVVRMDPFRFVAGCCTRLLNQA